MFSDGRWFEVGMDGENERLTAELLLIYMRVRVDLDLLASLKLITYYITLL